MFQLAVERSEISFQGNLERPAFTLLTNQAVELHNNLYTALRPFGLSLQNMQVTTGASDFSEIQAIYWLHSLSSSVKVFLDRVELNCHDFPKLGDANFLHLTVSALEALRRTLNDDCFQSYIVTLGLHATVLDGSPTKVLNQQFREPTSVTGAGPISGRGVAYYFGEQGNRLSAALVLDTSAILKEGLYVKGSVTFASDVELSQLPAMAEENLKAMYESVDLHWIKPRK